MLGEGNLILTIFTAVFTPAHRTAKVLRYYVPSDIRGRDKCDFATLAAPLLVLGAY